MKNTLIGLILGVIVTMWACYFYLYTRKPISNNPEISLTKNSPSPRPDQELITEALALKYNLAYAEVHTIISQINSTQASGTVSFSGEGGWFLAVKENDIWKIVADGNGTVSCETVSPYKFPVSMVPECVTKNGQLQKL